MSQDLCAAQVYNPGRRVGERKTREAVRLLSCEAGFEAASDAMGHPLGLSALKTGRYLIILKKRVRGGREPGVNGEISAKE